ncbi:hypothetical protein EJ08DRAFT_702965 [Tothia fuscella]|uniref:UBA domain-containing protein n=1 Tax=Tothia fuscella TaxID=1048955 RepID=A0A9P4NF98_9PEZI|nr:hypothetical protein EJ08DRAFT_702965 [Tothia fuscella]
MEVSKVSEANVSLCCEWSGVADREKVKKYLVATSGDMNLAIDNLLNENYILPAEGETSNWQGPGPGPAQADPWALDHEGGPSFQIYPSDNLGSDNGSTQGMPGSPPPNSPGNPPSPVSMTGKQESGLLDAQGNVFFGPARREKYDPSQWAMTIPSISAAEVLLDPDPPHRVREDKSNPVLMKPITPKDPLPALLTILYNVPLAREMLLCRGFGLEDYGSEPGWWSGTGIELPKIVYGDGREVRDNTGRDVIAEIQRLMAFMKASNRAYGSVIPLTNLDGLKNIPLNSNGWPSLKTQMDRFLHAWTEAVKAEGFTEASELFLSRAIKEDEIGTIDTDIPFYSMSLSFSRPNEPKSRSLYAATDDMIWSGEEDSENVGRRYLGQIPPVLIMHVENNNEADLGLDVDVPAEWYLDRYLEVHEAKAKIMRRKLATYRTALKRIEERKAKLRKIKGSAGEAGAEGKDISAELLFLSAIHFLNPNIKVREQAIKDKKEVVERELVDVEPRCEKMADELARVYKTLDRKLKELDTERETVERKLTEYSALLDDPLADLGEKPVHKYTLRGVAAIQENITYVLRDQPPSPSPENQNENFFESSTAEAQPQWYRLQYTDAPWILCDKISSEAEVLHFANNESRNVLLIYATDAAIPPPAASLHSSNHEPLLSEPLANFVATDNVFFQGELEEFAPSAEAMDTSWGGGVTQGSNGENPPAYGGWDDTYDGGNGRDAVGVGSWVPDSGPSVVSDAEYKYNSEYIHSADGGIQTGGGESGADKKGGEKGGVQHVEELDLV